MSETAIREYAQAKGFHPQTLERWLSWEASDRDALLSSRARSQDQRKSSARSDGLARRSGFARWRDDRGNISKASRLTIIKTDPRLGPGRQTQTDQRTSAPA